jgi:thiamine-monophosphate kinase
MLVAGRHFLRDTDPRRLGHKALAVNLSDLAAMGAKPRWATLGLALPQAQPRWVSEFAGGFMALARRFGVDLIGGDTTRGPLNICVQIMGEVPRGKALRRDGARIGDDIWVSGALGDAALGLAALQRRVRLSAAGRTRCVARLETPVPRIELGLALRGIAHSAIDVSDGLVADLGHILDRSGVGAEIEFAAVPASSILKRYLDRALARGALLGGGDDYELCFTAPASARDKVLRAGSRANVAVTRVGIIRRRGKSTPQLIVRAADGRPLKIARGGYDHFR